MNRSFIRTLIACPAILFASSLGSAMAADCAPPTLLNSLSMEQMPGSDTMTVPVTIEGQSARLMIGIADGSQLWNTQARKLGLAVQEGPRMMDGGGRFSEDVARVGSLGLGSMETGNYITQIGADPGFTGADGVLGTDMMMRYDIDLDFAHRKLNTFTPEQCQGAGVYWAPNKVTAVKMEAYADVVFMPVDLDGHRIVAALDTTADKTFLNPRIAQKLFGLTPETLTQVSLRDSGAVMQAGIRRFSSLTFGGLAFDNPEIAIPFDIQSQNTREFHASKTARDSYHLSEFLPDMIIGMDVLKQTHLYVSFRGQRVYVSPAGDGQVLMAMPAKTSWFNVWRHGYDTYLYPGRRPFFSL